MSILLRGQLLPLDPDDSSNMGQLLRQANIEQEKITLCQFCKGYPSRKWANTQELFVLKEQSCQKTDWSHIIVGNVIKYSYKMWKKRNEYIHGVNIKENREKCLRVSKQQVEEHYNK